MSSRNDEIRRQLGSAMQLPRPDLAEMVFSVRVIPPVDQRKQLDEQSDGTASIAAVADGATLYFDTFDDVLAWCDSEQARRE